MARKSKDNIYLMYIYKNNDAVPWEKCVATVGFFDGVHGGHRFLLNEVVTEARRTQSALWLLHLMTPKSAEW